MESDLTNAFKALPWVQGSHPIIGVGGTFRSLARVVRKSKNYVPDITDAYELNYNDVVTCYQRLSQMTLEERLTVPGLERARADIIVAGVAAIKCLMEVSGRQDIIISTTSIRDGLLYGTSIGIRRTQSSKRYHPSYRQFDHLLQAGRNTPAQSLKLSCNTIRSALSAP